MPPLRYWIMRTLRRHVPRWVVDTMLDRGIYLGAGGDTSVPDETVRHYTESAARHGLSLAGSRVCVVGSGGGIGIGIALLEAGASRVILQEPFAPPRIARDRQHLSPSIASKYLDGANRPRDDRLALVSQPLEQLAASQPASVDFVLSCSVLEHVIDLDSLIAASTKLMQPDGMAVHIVDMRDHYFRYPFEMLAYSQATWDRWLSASNTLNRLRRNDYERLFRHYFDDVRFDTLIELPQEFARAKARIRPEFLTGDDTIDAVAVVRVEARRPHTAARRR